MILTDYEIKELEAMMDEYRKIDYDDSVNLLFKIKDYFTNPEYIKNVIEKEKASDKAEKEWLNSCEYCRSTPFESMGR